MGSGIRRLVEAGFETENLSNDSRAGYDEASVRRQYPYLHEVSQAYGATEAVLVEVFELERKFHRDILSTESAKERHDQYCALYPEVHRLRRDGTVSVPKEGPQPDRLIFTFRRELQGKSVLDVGCGDGLFLRQLSRLLPHGHLCGLDADLAQDSERSDDVELLKCSVVDFRLGRTFDTVFSHQVLEHIAPADIPAHFSSIHNALVPGGIFVALLPNRHFGPSDITRIVDNTFAGRTPAMGSHLNESTYTELIPQLESAGFHQIRTALPFATFIPAIRDFRVRPWINLAFDKHGFLRHISHQIRLRGRPIFRNPIVLIGKKSA